MKEQVVQEIMCRMMTVLDNEQAKLLLETLESSLQGRDIVVTKGPEELQHVVDYAGLFLTSKRIEGCSEKTIAYYDSTIKKMHEYIGKKAPNITTDDLRKYLSYYQTERNASKTTIDNIRRILSSYYSWLEDEDFILKSPIRRIHKIKTTKVVKDTYSDEDIINLGIGELIRNDNFSPLELQRDILRNCSVFLPMDYILDCRKDYRWLIR